MCEDVLRRHGRPDKEVRTFIFLDVNYFVVYESNYCRYCEKLEPEDYELLMDNEVGRGRARV